MKTYYIHGKLKEVSYSNKVQCDAIKIEGQSIVCYTDEKVVGVFPCSQTLVTSEDLKPEPIGPTFLPQNFLHDEKELLSF